jgi:hypothetical protein
MKYINKYYEFVENDFSAIKSFYLKDELNPKIWDDFNLKDEIREQLLTIAQYFYYTTDLIAQIKDIVLTGSLANYNWSKYSDFDLHIRINFDDVNEDTNLVRRYVDAVKNIWNKNYNIKISGYDVEVYIENINEVHIATGVYSILNHKWVIRPVKTDFVPDEEEIKEKARGLMIRVDDLEENIDEYEYNEYLELLKAIWNKIKKYRKSSLEEGGEYSTGNLVFKLLRRNGYLEKIINLRRESYQKQFK